MSKPHFVALDGLRGIAAIAVVLFHRRWWVHDGHFLQHGYLAVDFFFMLSGFVIGYAYERRLLDGMSFGKFAVARLVRLYPLIFLGALFGFAYYMSVALLSGSNAELIRTSLQLPFALLALPMPALIASQAFILNPPTWSLTLELAANAVYGATVRKLSTRLLVTIAIASGVALTWAAMRNHSVSFGFTLKDTPDLILRITFPFSIGLLLYRAHAANKLPNIPLPFWLLGAILLATFVPDRPSTLNGLFDLAIIVLIYPAILVSAAQSRLSPTWTRLAGFSGALSYPVYMLHYPLLYSLDNVVSQLPAPGIVRICTSTAVIILVAIAAGRLYDEPIRAFLTNLISRQSGRSRAIVAETKA